MLDLLLLTVLVPLCGAGFLLVLSYFFTRLRFSSGRFGASILACGVGVAVLSMVFLLRARVGASIAVSSWSSSLLAESAIRLGLDGWLWPLGLALSLVTCSLLLAEVGRGAEASPGLGSVALALLAAGLAATWSANPLTAMVSWALYDLILTLGQIAVGGKSGVVVRRLGFGSLSVLCLWAGVLAAGNGSGSVQWSFMPPGGAKMTLWVLAGLLRLGAYPFHFSTPWVEAGPAPLATFLLGPTMGWALWMRLVLISGAVLTDNAWLLAPAALTFLVGGFLGWAADSPEQRRSWIGMGIGGAAMLAVLMASRLGSGDGSRLLPIMTVCAAGWMMSIPVLVLGGSLDSREWLHRRFWLPAGISVLGALHLVGLPPMVGFAAQSFLIGWGATAQPWGWRVTVFAGQLFLVAAVTRWLAPGRRSVPPVGVEHSRLARVARWAGLVCPVLLLIGIGLAPMLLGGDSARLSLEALLAGPGLAGWLLWAGALILGAILGWQDAYVRPRVSLWLNVLQDFVRMDWALELLAGAFEQGLSVLRAVDDVLGGRGALLWSLIIFLLAVLVWRVS